MPLEAAHLYHAIMEYAYALNETLANNLEPNGGNIINALKGHAFDSKCCNPVASNSKAG